MSLEEDFKKFQQKTLDRFVKVKQAAALGLFSAVVMETPVLKGVLRNNWFAEMNTIPNSLTEEADISGNGVIARLRGNLEQVNLLNSVYFVNNLPYARPIEFDGYSGKAPEGMLRVNVARWQEIVSEANRIVP